MSNQHGEMKVFTTMQVSKRGITTAFLNAAPEIFVFIDEEKKRKMVFGALTASMETCWYKAHKTGGQGRGKQCQSRKQQA